VNQVSSVVPYHLAIIMDGNGRWAQARGLPRTAGHQAGVQAARRAVESCIEMGVRALTLYTFSTENWCRPPEEVGFLMHLAEEYAARELPELQRNGVRLQLMGRRENLPISLLEVLDEAIVETQENSRLVLNLAINYGGRAEIVDAMRAVLDAHQRSVLDASHLNEQTFSRFLYCPGIPDVDLLLRTGGEWRLSNFLMWRAAKAIFWSIPVFWPDFQPEHLIQAFNIYWEQMNRHEIESPT